MRIFLHDIIQLLKFGWLQIDNGFHNDSLLYLDLKYTMNELDIRNYEMNTEIIVDVNRFLSNNTLTIN